MRSSLFKKPKQWEDFLNESQHILSKTCLFLGVVVALTYLSTLNFWAQLFITPLFPLFIIFETLHGQRFQTSFLYALTFGLCFDVIFFQFFGFYTFLFCLIFSIFNILHPHVQEHYIAHGWVGFCLFCILCCLLNGFALMLFHMSSPLGSLINGYILTMLCYPALSFISNKINI